MLWTTDNQLCGVRGAGTMTMTGTGWVFLERLKTGEVGTWGLWGRTRLRNWLWVRLFVPIYRRNTGSISIWGWEGWKLKVLVGIGGIIIRNKYMQVYTNEIIHKRSVFAWLFLYVWFFSTSHTSRRTRVRAPILFLVLKTFSVWSWPWEYKTEHIKWGIQMFKII